MEQKEKENKDIRYTKHGWVDLSELAKTSDGRYDWKNSIGSQIKFQYDNIQGTIVLKMYVGNLKYLCDILDYKADVVISSDTMCNNRLGKHLEIYKMEHIYSVGDIVNNCKIIKQIIIVSKSGKRKRGYVCKCIVDGYEREVDEVNLRANHGCPVCKNKIVIKGLNDIATTRPDIAKYFANKEDATKYTFGSNHKVELKCPICNHTNLYRIADVSKRGFSCKYCSDDISYPNKFTRNFLSQLFLNNDCKLEHTFDWSECVPTSFASNGKAMIYDVYIPMFNMIIENHGDQHYRKLGFGKLSSSCVIQENDRAKKQVAIDNGIYYYIEIDCRKSEANHIKNSIMNSELPNILGFTEQDIDWNECDKFATGSLFIQTIDLWNSGIHNKKDLAKIFDLNVTTIYEYLHKAYSLNLLNTENPIRAHKPYSNAKQSKSSQSAS